jgi:hypothetical protein
MDATSMEAEWGSNSELVAIEVETRPIASYAGAHNGEKLLHSLKVTPRRAQTLHDVVISIAVLDRKELVAQEWKKTYSTVPPGGILLTDIDLHLDPVAMSMVEEQREGIVEVTVSQSESVLGKQTQDFVLLAHNQWAFSPMAEDGNLRQFAAFVRPNDPVIREVLNKTSELLLKRTGSGALQGYQGGPDRVQTIARCIYDALSTYEWDYSNPPASDDVSGQKIRTHRQVLEERVATCLDSSVLFAACLEATGLNAVIWIPRGHAFVGWWNSEMNPGIPFAVPLGEDSIGELDTYNVFVNAVDVGMLSVVETTCLCRGTDHLEFDSAQRYVRANYVDNNFTKVDGVLDIHTCRRSGISPTPVSHTKSDGTVEVFAYEAPKYELPAVQKSVDGAPVVQRDAPERIERWKSALLDLTLKNQLINFRQRKGSVVRIVAGMGNLGTIEDILFTSNGLKISPVLEGAILEGSRGVGALVDDVDQVVKRALAEERALISDLTPDIYDKSIRGLRTRARQIVNETGANSLYLALGSLVWNSGGKEIRSPLLLVPVLIEGGTKGTPFRIMIDESGITTPNYCLLEKLRLECNLLIPELMDPESDGAGVDVNKVLEGVRKSIFAKELGFRVDETIDLAILQYSTFRLWKDLDDSWESFMGNELVTHLVKSPSEPFISQAASDGLTQEDSLDELAVLCPVPADATQLEAIQAAISGKTFVLEGPPGTGKSQTITNLLARCIAEGKTILFVAEKKPALDVVKTRLDAVGLGPFCLDLHDKASKPGAIREQLMASYQHQPLLDAIALGVSESELQSSVANLTRYRDRIHSQNTLGHSLHIAKDLLLAQGDGPSLEVSNSFVEQTDPLEWETIRRSFQDLPTLIENAQPRVNHPWRWVGVISPDLLNRSALREDVAVLQSVLEVSQTMSEVTPLIDGVNAEEDLEHMALFIQMGLPTSDAIDRIATPDWGMRARGLINDLKQSVLKYQSGTQVVPSVFDLPLDDLAAQGKLAAESGILGRKKKLQAVLDGLRPGLVPGAEFDLKAVPALVDDLALTRTTYLSVLATLRTLDGFEATAPVNALNSSDMQRLDVRLQQLDWAAKVASLNADPGNRTAFRLLADNPVKAQAALDQASLFLGAWNRISTALAVTQSSVAQVLNDRTLTSAIAAEIPAWLSDAHDDRFIVLLRYLALVCETDRLRQLGLGTAMDEILQGEVSSEDVVPALVRGVAQASISERCLAESLDIFDAPAHERSVERFVRSSDAMRTSMREKIPFGLVKSRPPGVALATGEMGNLVRELQRQRSRIGIRKLLTTWGSLITHLTPCVMASPDSIARFLTPGAVTFDVVVFDEASQIRVAEAVGAMGRAKSVVVVGDSKQMPPTSFGMASSGEEDEFDVDVEVESAVDEESILSECVNARIDRQWLSWHYRSQDESLIAFSNMNYYEGRLSSFPPPEIPDRTPGVSLVRVDGHFFRTGATKTLRTNPIEAQSVVDDVTRRLRIDPQASIGIVTFNIQQQNLVRSMLEASPESHVLEALERDDENSLFVRNLESVQGDERDVILFSIAFSANEKGVVPLNFGPLNKVGGERRLNVAVTRARRQVVVFCSFDPVELKVENSGSVGLSHLRMYLELAARGPEAVGAGARSLGQVDRHREDVAHRLSQMGWTVRTDVGLSEFRVDIAVASKDEPERDLCAVLLDGPGWAARGTVGDRDGLPVDVLSRMLRWPHVARVWLPEWLNNPDGVLASLDESLINVESDVKAAEEAEALAVAQAQVLAQSQADAQTQVLEEAPPPSVSAPTEPELMASPEPQELTNGPVVEESRDASADSPASAPAGLVTSPALLGEVSGVTFMPWNPGVRGRQGELDSLGDPSVQAKVSELVSEAIAAEGPIHRDRLARLVGGAFGFGRVAGARRDAIWSFVQPEIVRSEGGIFFWPLELSPQTWNGFRTQPNLAMRPLEEIPLQEINNAMRYFISTTGALDQEEIFRGTLALVGGIRLTEGISNRLRQAMG